MNYFFEIGDIVCFDTNKSFFVDIDAFYVITKLNKSMLPVEVISINHCNTHSAGERFFDKNLCNYLYMVKITASDLINKQTFKWLKETNQLELGTIVHFMGNNREIKFVIMDGVLISNITFEFYDFYKGLTKGPIAIQLSQNINQHFYSKISLSLKKIIQNLKLLF